MPKRYWVLTSVFVVAAGLSQSLRAEYLDPPVLTLAPAAILPEESAKAWTQGHDLPAPFGVSATAMFMVGHYRVDELRLALGPGEPTASPFVAVGEVKARAQSYMTRWDAWVLPFLDVYALAGYTMGTASTNVTVLPPLSPTGFAAQFPIKVRYEGPTIGGGATLAWGYEKFFVQLDGNYTYTMLDFPDSPVHCFVVDPRIGLRDKVGPFTAAVWVGAMWQYVPQTLTGTFNFLPGVATPFEADIRASEPWNYTIGTQWDYGKNFSFLAECGLGDRRHVMFSLMLRF